MKSAVAVSLLLAAFAPAQAEDWKLPPGIDKLSESADSSLNVTLDGPTLQLAARFLDDGDQHEASVKKLLAGIKGIYIRSLEFHNDNAYNRADLDTFRAQFQTPDWSRIVGYKNRDGEDADVFIRATPDGQLAGLCVISAEARELTIVHINGTIDPARIADLGGEWGMPHLEIYGRPHRREIQ